MPRDYPTCSEEGRQQYTRQPDRRGVHKQQDHSGGHGGTWISTGPAISFFKGEGFLKEAGGLAAAATIESKLAPYYKQYGLNGATVTIDKKGNVTLTVKGVTLRGTICDTSEQGVFDFSFTAMGAKNRHIQNIYPEIIEHYGYDVRRNQAQGSCVGDS